MTGGFPRSWRGGWILLCGAHSGYTEQYRAKGAVEDGQVSRIRLARRSEPRQILAAVRAL